MNGRVRRPGRTLRAFLEWWFGELAAMVPARLKRMVAGRGNRLVANVTESTVALWLVGRGRAVALDKVPLAGADEEAIAKRVRQAVATATRRRCDIDLTLPPSGVMEKSLDLPLAAEEDLEQMLAFEMDRLTPFQADDLCFDYRVVARDANTKRMRVEVAIVQRATVERALALAKRCGLTPDRVSVQTRDPAKPSPWRLVKRPPGRTLTRVQRLATAGLAALALALTGALVYLPLKNKADAVDSLSREIASARATAVQGAQLQNEVNTLTKQSRFLEIRKSARPSVVGVLNELTRVIPDNTWLFRLQYRDGEIQVYGFSDAAAQLIGKIGQSPVFEDPTFRAPVMRDKRADAERFHLTFHVAGAGETRH